MSFQMLRSLRPAVRACLVTCFVLCGAAQSLRSLAEEPTNIVWIEADDLMPRFMNRLGEGFGLTPNLDRLAKHGVHFPNAVAQGPMCGPSRNGLLTNLYSHNLGFYRNGDMRRLPAGIWTFPPTLQSAGYQTAYVGKSHIRPSEHHPDASKDETLRGFGFDFVSCTGERHALWKALQEEKNVDHVPFIQHLKRRGKYEQFLKDNDGHGNLSTMAEDIDYLDGYTAQVGIDWLSQQRDATKPFFLWFNFCLPHGPYDVPQRWYDKVSHLKIPPPKTSSFGHPVPEPLLRGNSPIRNEKHNAKNRLGEAANVAFMDAQIGRLLDAMETEGVLQNTLIIFFSDHSIFLGNHGREHKSTLFEEALNASMIVSYPKRFPQGKTNPHPVELMDLVPTTFEMAGVTNASTVAKNGHSLIPLLEGKATNGRVFAFSEIEGAQAATDARYRYIVCGDMEILYDHAADPWEMKNVAEEFPKVTARMREATQRWYQGTGAIHPPKTF